MNKSITLAITEGDPSGIGPEIILASLSKWGIPEDSRIAIIGYPKHFKAYLSNITSHGGLEWITPEPADLDFAVQPGVASRHGSLAAVASIEKAVSLAMSGKADAIITAPIHKANLREAGFSHPGHTEFLAELSGADRFAMMLVGGGLRVVLATIHEPLSKVPSLLTQEGLVKLIHLTRDAMADFGFESSRIGVAGLNPHAGEGGIFGREEIEIISPAIETARALGIHASGPHSADTLFHRARAGEFDVVIAMYHDQGLIPVKTLDFYGGVNVTLGLPFIRTSPDHGTAYDLAGTGRANPDSMIAALDLAYQLAKKRKAKPR